ncbi:hypothetical protein [Krasilnikovia sp. MM14-A1004]|uniref:hypothetical protein n=1 Tax=Krasilnikovia sp. MM14-A1004 TaxID=3373541 RepID=UPI00399D44D4
MQPPQNPDPTAGLPPPAQPPGPMAGSTAAPGPVVGAGPVGAGGAPPRPRNRRLRLWLAMGAGIMTLLCLGGVGVFVSLYDSATEIKRSAPDAVVDNFLRAYLVKRDDKEAALYMCKTGGDFSKLEAFRADLQDREKKFSIGIRVSWRSLTVANEGGQTTVSTEIVRTITDGSERTSDRWRFVMVDQDGWRVCGGGQVS